MKLTTKISAIVLVLASMFTATAFAQTPATTPTPFGPELFAQMFGPKADSPAKANSEGLFYFYDEVSDQSVLPLIKQLESFATDKTNDGKPIRIIMNSPGGSVFSGYALMDEIASVRTRGHHVKIQTYGMAASAAGWILQAADERVIGANSWILIHQISSQTAGKYAAIQADMKFTAALQDQFLLRLANRSKLTLAVIHEHIDAGQDWWIPADEALKDGLVDAVEPVPGFAPNK